MFFKASKFFVKLGTEIQCHNYSAIVCHTIIVFVRYILHSGIQYVTPEERHTGKDKEVLEKRKKVYEEAKKKHPERWVRKTRDWSYSEEEWLNPKQEKETKTEAKAS